MSAGLRIISVFVFDALIVSAQSKPASPPRFEDYLVTKIFAGQPAPPKLITPAQRRYRTRIRQGVEKGWGVRQDGIEQNKPEANFAGDMIFIQWGCGAPRLMAALANARTGEVFNPPLAVDGTLFMPFLVIGESVGGNPELEFRANSRLMIISATPNWLKPHARSYRHYFVWESNQWRLVHRESLD